MSVIKLSTLGGLLPSVSPRALPETAAQKAHNILASTPEFRPLQTDVAAAVSAIANPKTIHRLARKLDGTFSTDMSTGWRTSSLELNYVKGQLNDERTERTYYTFADGTQAPRVLDVTGFDKPLGVPAPTIVQGATITNYTFTPEERANGLLAARGKYIQLLFESLTIEWVGAEHPGCAPGDGGVPRSGWVDGYGWNDPIARTNPNFSQVFRVFQVAGDRSNVVTSSYSALLAAACSFIPAQVATSTSPVIPASPGVFDGRFGGFYVPPNNPFYRPAWGNTSAWHFVIPVYAYGQTYTFDTETVVTKWKSVRMPGDASKQLFTDDQARAFLNNFKATYGKGGAYIKPLTDAISTQFSAFAGVIDSGMVASLDYIATNLEALKESSEAIAAAYADIRDNKLQTELANFYFTSGVDGTVPAGKERIIEDRFYVMTFVTAWGEESAPSAVQGPAEVDQDDEVSGAPMNPPPGYGITKFRYYRTNAGTTGAAFQFVDEVALSATSLNPSNALSSNPALLTFARDSKKASELGEVCPTLTWAMPPAKLQGLVGMSNGVMAGYFDNTVCFCESWIPYAWPVEYRVTTAFPILALGAFGQTLVVFHAGGVDYISGADAASMAHDKNRSLNTCAARRSVVNFDDGVCYASNKGICIARQNGVELLTASHFLRKDWTALQPATIFAGSHDGAYFFARAGSSCYALDLASGKLTTVDLQGSCFYTDLLTDTLYMANGTSIMSLFTGPSTRTGIWRTKVAVMPEHVGFAWCGIESAFEAPITVRWFGDGALVYEVAIISRAPVRLPIGRFLEHEIEIESTARWNKLTFASSGDELRDI